MPERAAARTSYMHMHIAHRTCTCVARGHAHGMSTYMRAWGAHGHGHDGTSIRGDESAGGRSASAHSIASAESACASGASSSTQLSHPCRLAAPNGVSFLCTHGGGGVHWWPFVTSNGIRR